MWIVKPDLIETMLANDLGQIELWNLHMARLGRSARALGYPFPGIAPIAIEVGHAIGMARMQQQQPQWRVRLLLSPQGNIAVTATGLPPLQGLPKVIVASSRLDSQEFWLRHKSTHRPWYEKATKWLADHPDYFDVLYINERGELCEGSRSNIYVPDQGLWLTPALNCGLLPGVWRTKLLDSKQITESVIPATTLQHGGQIRLSNGLRGWFDVVVDLKTRLN